jgi:hypothetical protein
MIFYAFRKDTSKRSCRNVDQGQFLAPTIIEKIYSNDFQDYYNGAVIFRDFLRNSLIITSSFYLERTKKEGRVET